MKKMVFGLFDKVAEVYLTPIFVPNAAVVMRDISDMLRRGGEGNSLAAHPGDYCLHEFGSFDDEAGKFELLAKPRMCFEVSSLVEKPPVVGDPRDC